MATRTKAKKRTKLQRDAAKAKKNREERLKSATSPAPINTYNNYVFGRPTIYDPAMCDVVIEKFGQGYSVCEVCVKLGIAQDTFYDWQKKYEDFSEAIRIGLTAAQAWWEQMSRNNLSSREFNANLWSFNMKNRFGYRDKQEIVQKDEKSQIVIEVGEPKQIESKIEDAEVVDDSNQG